MGIFSFVHFAGWDLSFNLAVEEYIAMARQVVYICRFDVILSGLVNRG